MNTVKSLALAALLVPSAALAQARPKYEFGVDAGIAYATNDGTDGFTIGTPLDVRVGILKPGPMSFEPRFTFSHVSVEGTSVTSFTPTVNVLYQAGKRAVVQRGMYFTAGLGLNISRFSNDDLDISESETDPTINFGIGTRRGITQAAFRPEGFIAYGLDSETLTLGGRFGLSFWK